MFSYETISQHKIANSYSSVNLLFLTMRMSENSHHSHLYVTLIATLWNFRNYFSRENLAQSCTEWCNGVLGRDSRASASQGNLKESDSVVKCFLSSPCKKIASDSLLAHKSWHFIFI